MSSKAFAFLGLLFAIVVLISAEAVAVAAARDLAPTPKNNDVDTMKMNGAEDGKYGWRGKSLQYFFPRHGNYGVYPDYHGDYSEPGVRIGRCRYGCCGNRDDRGQCSRCCNGPFGEVVDAKP